MGYTGGTKDSPTYRSLGDHAEAIRVVYDPDTVTYDELLDVFWDAHDPHGRAWSTQYAPAIYVHDEAQQAAAERSRDALQERTGREVRTPIRPAGAFWPAEDYHQKHDLRSDRALQEEVRALFESEDAMVESKLAARVNACLAGHKVPAADLAPLSAETREALWARCGSGESWAETCGH